MSILFRFLYRTEAARKRIKVSYDNSSKEQSRQKQMDNLVKWIKGLGLDIHMSKGDNTTIMGLIGDTSVVDEDLIRSLDIVESVKRIQEPYKNANRKFHPEDTIVDVNGHLFGGKHFQLIAGPCSVESEDQVVAVARAVKKRVQPSCAAALSSRERRLTLSRDCGKRV